MVRKPSYWTFVLLLSLAACGGGAEPEFAGRFADTALALELSPADEGYAGSLSLDGSRYPLEATVDGDVLAGTFRDEGSSFAFTARFEAEELVLETGGTTYRLASAAPVNPLAASRTEPTSEPAPPDATGAPGTSSPAADEAGSTGSTAPVEAAAAGEARELAPSEAESIAAKLAEATANLADAPTLSNTYKHRTGFYFRYPDTWRVEEGEQGVMLVPPDPVRVRGEAAEAIFVVGDTADGVSRPTDRRVGEYLDQLFASGFLKRVGKPEERTYPRHTGAAYAWRGTSPEGYGEFRAGAWITILEGYAIGAFVLAPEGGFDARARVVEDVFATFGFEEPDNDPRLFGYWRYTRVTTSGTFSLATDNHLWLNADGTCSRSSRSMGGGEVTDGFGNAMGSSSVDSGDSGTTKGRWYGKDGRISLEWSDGREEWEYVISGNDMMFRSGDSKRLWERIR